jgi:predicted dehydrogenase
MINVGIIGYREAAIRYHIPSFRLLKNAAVPYIADSNKKKLENARTNMKCRGYFEDYNELLDKKDVDLVDICTKSASNAEVCIDAANIGKNILVESPFACSVLEAKKIKNVMEKTGVKICIVQNFRFMSTIYPVIRMLEHGELGRILSIHEVISEVVPRLNPKIDPIVLYPESIDLLTLFGGNPKRVLAKTMTFLDDPEQSLEPEIKAFIEFENGCVGFLDWSSYSASYNMMIDVYGTGTGVKIDILKNSYETLNWWWRPSARVMALKDLFSNIKKVLKRPFSEVLLDSGYLILISEFLKSIENDTPAPVSIDDGIKFITLIDGIKKSFTNNIEVSF